MNGGVSPAGSRRTACGRRAGSPRSPVTVIVSAMPASTTSWNCAATAGLAPPNRAPDEGARQRHQAGGLGLVEGRAAATRGPTRGRSPRAPAAGVAPSESHASISSAAGAGAAQEVAAGQRRGAHRVADDDAADRDQVADLRGRPAAARRSRPARPARPRAPRRPPRAGRATARGAGRSPSSDAVVSISRTKPATVHGTLRMPRSSSAITLSWTTARRIAHSGNSRSPMPAHQPSADGERRHQQQAGPEPGVVRDDVHPGILPGRDPSAGQPGSCRPTQASTSA